MEKRKLNMQKGGRRCFYSALCVEGTQVKQSCSETWDNPERMSPSANISDWLKPSTFFRSLPENDMDIGVTTKHGHGHYLVHGSLLRSCCITARDNVCTLFTLGTSYKDQEWDRAHGFQGKCRRAILWCCKQLEKQKEIIIIQLKLDTHASLDRKHNSLPPIILSHTQVYYSLENQINVSSRQLNSMIGKRNSFLDKLVIDDTHNVGSSHLLFYSSTVLDTRYKVHVNISQFICIYQVRLNVLQFICICKVHLNILQFICLYKVYFNILQLFAYAVTH